VFITSSLYVCRLAATFSCVHWNLRCVYGSIQLLLAFSLCDLVCWCMEKGFGCHVDTSLCDNVVDWIFLLFQVDFSVISFQVTARFVHTVSCNAIEFFCIDFFSAKLYWLHLFRYTNVGILILFLHDITDILLEGTKLAVYYKTKGGKWNTVCDLLSTVGFVMFGAAW